MRRIRWALAAAVVASSCSAGGSDAPPVTSTDPPAATAVSTSTSTTAPPCPELPADGGATLDPDAAATLEQALADLVAAVPDARVGVSIRIEGFGEVLAHEADEPLPPASNQKLFTGYAVRSTLDPSTTLRTTVAATGPVSDGVVTGDLVLVAGGDPTLTSAGDHSLAALADRVTGAGVTTVEGDLVVDASRHVRDPIPEGRAEGGRPRLGGPLSVLMVDDNEARADEAFLADPDLEHARTFAALLRNRGVAVSGEVRRSDEPLETETEVASIVSAPIGEMIDEALLESDNESADLLLREVGLEALGEGSLAAGSRHLVDLLRAACVEVAPTFGDGAGISSLNLHSAREMRRLVDLLLADPVGRDVLAALPIAGETGTLADRFVGSPAEGVLQAKTGMLRDVLALTGVTETGDGFQASFSILVHGPGAPSALAQVDALAAAISSV